MAGDAQLTSSQTIKWTQIKSVIFAQEGKYFKPHTNGLLQGRRQCCRIMFQWESNRLKFKYQRRLTAIDTEFTTNATLYSPLVPTEGEIPVN